MSKSEKSEPKSSSERRPSHIIVFKRPKETNAPLVAKVIGAKTSQVASRASCSILKTSNDQVDGKVYHGLGVAAADLTPSQIQELRTNDDVLAVVPNKRRTLPPPIVDNRQTYGNPDSFTKDRNAENIFSRTGLSDLPGKISDPVLSYFTGLRDAADLAVRFMQAQQGLLQQGENSISAAASDRHSWCLSIMGLTPDYSKATGIGVRVAVLDTGIDLDHPDFSGRFQEGNNAVSFVAGESVQDGNGHGTHCAGVIGGPADGGIGNKRYGVAPDVELIIGKVLDNNGDGFDDQILDAIDWAANDMGANIISMSLGSSRSPNQTFTEEYEQVAEVLLTQGVLLVAAAGNDSQRPFFTAAVDNPAACPSIWAVAAVAQDLSIASFSGCKKDNIGEVNVSGPGVAVYSSWTGGGYKTISGTSMATPHVAAVAALFKERSPSLTAKQLQNKIIASCKNLGNSNDFGHGLVKVP